VKVQKFAYAQRAYCQNCGITTRDKNFVIFAPLLALKECWDARNFGNTPGVSGHAGRVVGN